MVSGGSIMVDVGRWVRENSDALFRRGIGVRVAPRNPLHADRPKMGQSIQLAGHHHMAEVVFWDRGECEMPLVQGPGNWFAVVSPQDLCRGPDADQGVLAFIPGVPEALDGVLRVGDDAEHASLDGLAMDQ